MPHFFITACLLIMVVVQPARADETKEALQSKLSQLQNFQAAFVQRVRADDGTLLQEQFGTLILAQPNRLNWQVDIPDETRLIADGKTVWYVDTFIEQVSIFNQSSLAKNNPMMLLASNDPSLWANFSITSNDTAHFQINALSEDGQIQALSLSFVQNNLSEMTLTDRQGQVSQFSFSEVSRNLPLSSDVFMYSIPEGYSVDDQR